MNLYAFLSFKSIICSTLSTKVTFHTSFLITSPRKPFSIHFSTSPAPVKIYFYYDSTPPTYDSIGLNLNYSENITIVSIYHHFQNRSYIMFSKIKVFILFAVLIIMIIYFLRSPNTPIPTEDPPMPTKLHPLVEEKSNQLIKEAKGNGIEIIITDGFRSNVKQDALYAQGRTEPGDIVTNVKGGNSYHNYGLAIDFALKVSETEVIWDLTYDGNNNGNSDWLEVVDIAKELGFTWGGDWENFRDYPHLQYDFGLSIFELKLGRRPN